MKPLNQSESDLLLTVRFSPASLFPTVSLSTNVCIADWSGTDVRCFAPYICTDGYIETHIKEVKGLGRKSNLHFLP